MSRALHTPPGFDLHRELAPLNSQALVHSPEYRRWVTRCDPLLFALVYFEDHLSSPETDGELSLSQFHLDFAGAAQRWVRRDLRPREVRDAWIAPRGGAKSTWGFLIAPTWALAHGHRRFATMFADSGPQAQKHFANLKRELDRNELLRLDYPGLCEPAKRRGHSESDNLISYVAASGQAILAKGIDSATLGAKHGNTRPDLILFDDIEPQESRYSAAGKDKRLRTILDAVLPMNDRAVVQFLGTTTMYGSIMHDLVRSAVGDEVVDWVGEERVRPHYYPAIVTDADGTERSLWPQRWSLPYLQSIRHTRNYAMNMCNLPPSTEGGLWTPEDIRVDPQARAGRRVLMVDPAVTRKTTSDFTGLAVVGMEQGPSGRAVVEFARGVRVSPAGLRKMVAGILGGNPSIRSVRVESNQGGEVWLDALSPIVEAHSWLQIELHHTSESKPSRFARALDWYQRGWVVHSRALPALTEQQLSYPNVAHDDVVDAVVAGLEHWLGDRPMV